MWDYESNDYENISLHDQTIDEIMIENKNILLIFNDGFDVVKTHPLNDTQKSKHTTKSQIVLEDYQFICGTASYSGQDTGSIDFFTMLSEFTGFEVLEFQRNGLEFVLMGNLDTLIGKKYFAKLLFSCSNITFCWNDYSSEAWFEGR